MLFKSVIFMINKLYYYYYSTTTLLDIMFCNVSILRTYVINST